jgi:hypothetical protein
MDERDENESMKWAEQIIFKIKAKLTRNCNLS